MHGESSDYRSARVSHVFLCTPTERFTVSVGFPLKDVVLVHVSLLHSLGCSSFFPVFRGVRIIAKSDYRVLYVFVRTEQLGPHWTDFHEILYLSAFRKSVEEIQVLLKSGKNNAYFT
jgi:hypothetical protein